MRQSRPELLGRDAERARLDEMISAVRSGESRVLVVHGGAGIGKTALLAYARDAATGTRVLRAAGVESEMELAFATLHQLCLPLLDRLANLANLAPGRREALETVFRMRAGATPDQFLVGLALLDLLSDASEDGPLLCLIDDMHWVDRASAQVLGFVARRLLAESVGLLFGVRVPGPELRGLPGLEVTALRDPDAYALLDAISPARLDRHIRDRIVAETHGNPLALIELPQGLTTTQMAGGLGLINADALPNRIEETFRQRIRELPAPARLLLLLASAEPVGDPDLVRGAAARLGLSLAVGDIDEFLSFGERVTFRHPLVRSAAYRAAETIDRRAVHLALAEVTDAKNAPEQRAWHRAAAAAGPDESVAAELQRSAGRAQARGGLAAAAAFLQRSVALTADPAHRTDRMLAAAEASLGAGEFNDARRLVEALGSQPLDALQNGRVAALRGQMEYASGRSSAAIPLMLEAARQFVAASPALARETSLHAWAIASSTGDRNTIVAVSHAVREILPPPGDDPLGLLIDGVAGLAAGERSAAVESLRQASVAIVDLPVAEVMRWGRVASAAFAGRWDLDGLLRVSTRQLALVREAGALQSLPEHLVNLGYALIWTGDLDEAAAAVEEIEMINEATGREAYPPYATLRLLALRGREPETVALITDTLRDAEATGLGTGLTGACWAGTVLYNGLARYPEALRFARDAEQRWDPWNSVYLLPELVEAAVRTGEERIAREALDRLVETTQPSGTDCAAGLQARSQALVHGDESRYREAIELLGRTRMRPDLARAHLLYGEWLRRLRRRIEAREQLRTAYDMFVSIGMDGFAERARRELLATGESVRKRAAGSGAGDELTAQERQIALLVRAGLSNPEVGARLFISPRTVEWHLRSVFGKLGIDSRRQLRDVLPDSG
ncbi:AAA family ATPase [Actinoplanes sp. NPDC024001]|uniref:AAA family ATPase n=1 Tax=Actinoplanes sp. NPDC024001 TaxID=3154598 RepID=UPI0033ED3A99